MFCVFHKCHHSTQFAIHSSVQTDTITQAGGNAGARRTRRISHKTSQLNFGAVALV